MENNINFIQKKIMIISKRKILNKYGDSIKNYNKHKIFDILFSRNSNFTINYKEAIILSNIQEYNKRFYKINDSISKLIKILKYYLNYLTFFCRPIFTNFSYNDILQNYYDIQADIFYRNNYLKNKEEKEEILKNDFKINDDEKDQSIFDFFTRKYIETSSKLTSIDKDDEDKNSESFIQKIKTNNNKYITIKSNDDDYLFELIDTIKTKRKEKTSKNKNVHINLNFSLSKVKKNSSKKNQNIKKNKIIFNSNKNTIENNICNTYNIIKTMTKKRSIEKISYNGKIFNSNINLSDIKKKLKKKYIDSQKKLEKYKISKNKNSNVSGKKKVDLKRLKDLKKKIIKKLTDNFNKIKPRVFNIYKKNCLNLKHNNINNNCKINSFSINNSIIKKYQTNNIYNKLYNSNSNSPLNHIKKLKKENKSDILNITKNVKTNKKINIKKNLNVISLKKSKKHTNINTNNNDFINNNYANFNLTNVINQNNKNKYNCCFKKTSTNNSLNKKHSKKLNNLSKNNKTIKEYFNSKKSIGIKDKNFINKYFSSKFLRTKSFLKKQKNFGNGENIHTFSMRLSQKKKKNKSTSDYLNLNNQFFNQNFSLYSIYNYNKKNNIGGNNKLKNSYNCKNIKYIKNKNIERFQKNINNYTNIKLLYNNKLNKIEKNGVNLNVNLNLNNINININASSANTTNNNFNDKILDKLDFNNLKNESNFNIKSNKNICNNDYKFSNKN